MCVHTPSCANLICIVVVCVNLLYKLPATMCRLYSVLDLIELEILKWSRTLLVRFTTDQPYVLPNRDRELETNDSLEKVENICAMLVIPIVYYMALGGFGCVLKDLYFQIPR